MTLGAALVCVIGAAIIGAGMACSPIVSDIDRPGDGLLKDWELREYSRVRPVYESSDGWVSYFGRDILRKAPVSVIGHISGIRRDISAFQLAQFSVSEVLYSRLPGYRPVQIDLFSRVPKYFDAMRGAHVVFLKPMSADGRFQVVDRLPLDPALAEHQVETVRELMALDLASVAAAERRVTAPDRRRALRDRAFAGLGAAEDWVASVWAFQLAGLATTAPGIFDRRDLARLRSAEFRFVRNRPQADGAIRSIVQAIENLVRHRYKRVWVGEVLSGTASREDRLVAARALAQFATESYRNAWEPGDRRVIVTVLDRELDRDVREALSIADSGLAALDALRDRRR